MTEVIVVGSGASGANAAAAIVEAGCRVTLLDVGNTNDASAPAVPHQDFTTSRRSDPEQHRYFLGEHFEGIPLGEVRVGAQLTPPRRFINADVDRLTPTESDTFALLESLALGGLASGWGAGAFPFSDDDLRDLPISRSDLAPHYEAVAERIGVSGERDDLLPYFGDSACMQPSLDLDSSAECVLERYHGRREAFNARGFYLGRPRMAVSTLRHRGRGPHEYLDMDYWADLDRSVYRPRWTIEELQRSPLFTYVPRRLVRSFRDQSDGVEVSAMCLDSDAVEVRWADALVLAAGTPGTARIVLRSLGRFNEPVPLTTNPQSYVPIVNLGMLGRTPRDRRHGLAQLTAFHEPRSPGAGPVQVQLYSYRSLLTFKLMKELPLPFREAVRLVPHLVPVLGVLLFNYEDAPTESKYCVLRREGSGDNAREWLEIHYRATDDEDRMRREQERRTLALFRELGCWPLKRIPLKPGASVHYAGTFPMVREARDLTCDVDCRLAGTRSVYLADGSVFSHLPAKGLTFTMMANANRVGAAVASKAAWMAAVG